MWQPSHCQTNYNTHVHLHPQARARHSPTRTDVTLPQSLKCSVMEPSSLFHDRLPTNTVQLSGAASAAAGVAGALVATPFSPLAFLAGGLACWSRVTGMQAGWACASGHNGSARMRKWSQWECKHVQAGTSEGEQSAVGG